MTSRVTTKHGDDGTTRTLAGEHLSKAHPIMQAVGAVDECRAQIALLRQGVLRERPEDTETADLLRWMMTATFPIGTECSDPERHKPAYRAVEIGPKHLEHLEAAQARMEDAIVWPKAFIAGGSTLLSAQADVAAVAARHLERCMVALHGQYPDFGTDILLAFVNRLSDSLYVMARYLEDGQHDPVDYSLLGP